MIHLQVLDNDTKFGPVMPSDVVKDICKDEEDGKTSNGLLNSVFKLESS